MGYRTAPRQSENISFCNPLECQLWPICFMESWSWICGYRRSWSVFFYYAFPSFSLISRVLAKVRQDQACIAPVGTIQVWFSTSTKSSSGTKYSQALTLGKMDYLMWSIQDWSCSSACDCVYCFSVDDFLEGKAYSAVHTCRSAVSTTTDKVYYRTRRRSSCNKTLLISKGFAYF